MDTLCTILVAILMAAGPLVATPACAGPSTTGGGCLHSAAAAKADGASWASYTLRASGHRHQRCWYPTTKALRHAHGPAKAAVYALSRLRPALQSAFGQVVADPLAGEDWHGERLTVAPEADTGLAYWLLGDNLQFDWEPLLALQERRAAGVHNSPFTGVRPVGDDIGHIAAAFAAFPADGFERPDAAVAAVAKSDSARLTSIWIAREDVASP